MEHFFQICFPFRLFSIKSRHIKVQMQTQRQLTRLSGNLLVGTLLWTKFLSILRERWKRQEPLQRGPHRPTFSPLTACFCPSLLFLPFVWTRPPLRDLPCLLLAQPHTSYFTCRRPGVHGQGCWHRELSENRRAGIKGTPLKQLGALVWNHEGAQGPAMNLWGRLIRRFCDPETPLWSTAALSPLVRGETPALTEDNDSVMLQFSLKPEDFSWTEPTRGSINPDMRNIKLSSTNGETVDAFTLTPSYLISK